MKVTFLHVPLSLWSVAGWALSTELQDLLSICEPRWKNPATLSNITFHLKSSLYWPFLISDQVMEKCCHDPGLLCFCFLIFVIVGSEFPVSYWVSLHYVLAVSIPASFALLGPSQRQVYEKVINRGDDFSSQFRIDTHFNNVHKWQNQI